MDKEFAEIKKDILSDGFKNEPDIMTFGEWNTSAKFAIIWTTHHKIKSNCNTETFSNINLYSIMPFIILSALCFRYRTSTDRLFQKYAEIVRSKWIMLRPIKTNWQQHYFFRFTFFLSGIEPSKKNKLSLIRLWVLWFCTFLLGIKNLSAEVFKEGRLVLNTNGRYEVNGFELTAGSPIEYWDKHYEEWSEDRIEHFNGKYGFYYKKINNLDGLYVRIRKSYWMWKINQRNWTWVVSSRKLNSQRFLLGLP